MTEPTDQTPVQTDAQTPVPAPEGGAEGLEGTPEGNGHRRQEPQLRSGEIPYPCS
jgi:hypothetical protein